MKQYDSFYELHILPLSPSKKQNKQTKKTEMLLPGTVLEPTLWLLSYLKNMHPIFSQVGLWQSFNDIKYQCLRYNSI